MIQATGVNWNFSLPERMPWHQVIFYFSKYYFSPFDSLFIPHFKFQHEPES